MFCCKTGRSSPPAMDVRMRHDKNGNRNGQQYGQRRARDGSTYKGVVPPPHWKSSTLKGKAVTNDLGPDQPIEEPISPYLYANTLALPNYLSRPTSAMLEQGSARPQGEEHLVSRRRLRLSVAFLDILCERPIRCRTT